MDQQFEILNPEVHQALRMTRDVGEQPLFVGITIDEFPAAAAVCPIFLAKNPTTGEFYVGAMFGFKPGELLVEWADQGAPQFRPLELQRQGFFVADENIVIDPAHPRFGDGASVALFGDSGEPSEAMRNIQRVLGQLASGAEATNNFIRWLLRLKLVEPIDITLAFDDGEKLTLDGLYTVSRDALYDLEDADLLGLFRQGYLQAAFCMSFSLNQVAILARRRNERIAADL